MIPRNYSNTIAGLSHVPCRKIERIPQKPADFRQVCDEVPGFGRIIGWRSAMPYVWHKHNGGTQNMGLYIYIYGFIWVQSHTLAQKHHCEFCCGVHRSCTKQSLQNWQERLVDSTRTSVRSMLSTSLLKGRFWCSWTIHTWSKVIPDCDNSAEKKWKLSRHAGTWLSRSP